MEPSHQCPIAGSPVVVGPDKRLDNLFKLGVSGFLGFMSFIANQWVGTLEKQNAELAAGQLRHSQVMEVKFDSLQKQVYSENNAIGQRLRALEIQVEELKRKIGEDRN